MKSKAFFTIFCALCIQITFGEKSNVVLVMADDIGLGDLGFYQKKRNPGQKPTVEVPQPSQAGRAL